MQITNTLLIYTLYNVQAVELVPLYQFGADHDDAVYCTGSVDICFIFSGETEENRLGIIQGQADVPLNDTGRQQARLAAEKLACETFTSIYSSDLIRVKEV